jgi:hypothetical protein
MEFTGDYYKCKHCGKVYDVFNGICPFCGYKVFPDILTSDEVKYHFENCDKDEVGRLINMLQDHGDYNPF